MRTLQSTNYARPTQCEQTIASYMYVLIHVYTCTYMCMSNYLYMYDYMFIYMYKYMDWLILRDDEMGRILVIKRENIPTMSSCCNELVKTYGEAGRSSIYISNKDSEFSL